MDELLVGLVIVDQMNGGKGMRAIYERIGDEPRRPVRRRVAAVLRYVAARMAPLVPEAAPEPVVEVLMATEQAAS
jgi:hypothetical protein